MDSSGGHPVQEVLLSQRRLELRHRHVGSDVVWRAALLGDVQSGCELDLSLFSEYIFFTICVVTEADLDVDLDLYLQGRHRDEDSSLQCTI